MAKDFEWGWILVVHWHSYARPERLEAVRNFLRFCGMPFSDEPLMEGGTETESEWQSRAGRAPKNTVIQRERSKVLN